MKRIRFDLEHYKSLLIKNESSNFKDPELANYEGIITGQVFYQERNQYLKLIQTYLDQKISLHSFLFAYLDMIQKTFKKTDKILTNFEELSNFWIDPGGRNLGYLFCDIQELCESISEFGLVENRTSTEDNLLEKILKDGVRDIEKLNRKLRRSLEQ